jgi:S1-C subfamily serine protease
LHRAPEEGALHVVAKRGASQKSLSLDLADGWRAKADISRRVGTWGLRGMATGGLVLETLSDEERDRRGLKKDAMALLVKHVGEYGTHAAAKKAGFKKEDVMVELNGSSRPMTEGELIGSVLEGHQPGEKLKAIVLRGSERVELELPVQ